MTINANANFTVTEQQLVDQLVKSQSAGEDLEKFRARIERVGRGKVSYSHLANMMSGRRALNTVTLRFLGWERVTVTTFRKLQTIDRK